MNKDEFKIIRLLHTNMASLPLPDQMKAQIINKHNKPYDFTTAPLPQIACDNDLLIKVEAAGYCHYDESLVHGHRKSEPKIFPHIGGHIAGAVVLLLSSPSLAAQKLSIGAKVGSLGCGFGSCGICFECTNSSIAQLGYSFFYAKTLSNGFTNMVTLLSTLLLMHGNVSCFQTAYA